MVFLAIPNHAEDAVEDWYVTHMNEMTSKGSEKFMNELPVIPDDLKKSLEGTINQKSNMLMKLKQPRRYGTLRHEMFWWYVPIVVRDLVKTFKGSSHRWGQSLDGFEICFENKADSEAKVLMDVVLVSDEGEDGEFKKKKKKKLFSKEHLTPLERNFQESIGSAYQILGEMRSMERREQRMKQTAEGINARIRYFSYISVAVLLGVTWMQVTYLRNYFKKKKLL